MSGYPSRAESEHDIVENSHASTGLSYALALATARELRGDGGKVICVIGDGALTGGMAYEALNNIGQRQPEMIIILNDNGRSYAPLWVASPRTSASSASRRSTSAPRWPRGRRLRQLPVVGQSAYGAAKRMKDR